MKKLIDLFLVLLMPFLFIYMATLLFWAYFVNSGAKGGYIDVVIIVMISFFLTLGVFTLIRDLHLFGRIGTFNLWKAFIDSCISKENRGNKKSIYNERKEIR